MVYILESDEFSKRHYGNKLARTIEKLSESIMHINILIDETNFPLESDLDLGKYPIIPYANDHTLDNWIESVSINLEIPMGMKREFFNMGNRVEYAQLFISILQDFKESIDSYYNLFIENEKYFISSVNTIEYHNIFMIGPENTSGLVESLNNWIFNRQRDLYPIAFMDFREKINIAQLKIHEKNGIK